MNIQDAFPSKFLKASDLQGMEPIVTIDQVKYEPVGKDKEMKAVLYFKGKEKGLVLNKTNANKITELLQSGITEEWQGQRVRLFATETQFGGDMVDCIRVKAASSNGAAKGQPKTAPVPRRPVEDVPVDELTDDEIPF